MSFIFLLPLRCALGSLRSLLSIINLGGFYFTAEVLYFRRVLFSSAVYFILLPPIFPAFIFGPILLFILFRRLFLLARKIKSERK